MKTFVRAGAAFSLLSLLVLVVVYLSVRPVTAQEKVEVLKLVRPDVAQELQVARQVLATPQIKKAFDYVDGAKDDMVREWVSLANTYGSQGDEIYRARKLYQLFRMYGLERVHIDDMRNVIGVRPGKGGGPTVVLNAHFDAVALWPKDQPIEAFVADGRIWAPSAGDDLAGVEQLLGIVRAMNAANIETKGDVWFVGLTGEEVGSYGSEQFTRAHYPHHIDWRKGDIIVQLHGGGGEGVTTGSNPYVQFAQLRMFVPIGWNRWRTDAVDGLVKFVDRINRDLRDVRTGTMSDYEAELNPDLIFLNMAMIQGYPIHNGTSTEAWVRFDMRAPSEARLAQLDADIMRIAAAVCKELGEGFTYHYEVNMKLGVDRLAGWDKTNNAPARMIAATAQALYGTTPYINPGSGCGDCRRSYMEGMPMFSLGGNVLDLGGGKFEVRPKPQGLDPVRRKSSGHDVTESTEINRIWSGIKHTLLFAASYSGLAQ